MLKFIKSKIKSMITEKNVSLKLIKESKIIKNERIITKTKTGTKIIFAINVNMDTFLKIYKRIGKFMIKIDKVSLKNLVKILSFLSFKNGSIYIIAKTDNELK